MKRNYFYGKSLLILKSLIYVLPSPTHKYFYYLGYFNWHQIVRLKKYCFSRILTLCRCKDNYLFFWQSKSFFISLLLERGTLKSFLLFYKSYYFESILIFDFDKLVIKKILLCGLISINSSRCLFNLTPRRKLNRKNMRFSLFQLKKTETLVGITNKTKTHRKAIMTLIKNNFYPTHNSFSNINSDPIRYNLVIDKLKVSSKKKQISITNFLSHQVTVKEILKTTSNKPLSIIINKLNQSIRKSLLSSKYKKKTSNPNNSLWTLNSHYVMKISVLTLVASTLVISKAIMLNKSALTIDPLLVFLGKKKQLDLPLVFLGNPTQPNNSLDKYKAIIKRKTIKRDRSIISIKLLGRLASVARREWYPKLILNYEFLIKRLSSMALYWSKVKLPPPLDNLRLLEILGYEPIIFENTSFFFKKLAKSLLENYPFKLCQNKSPYFLYQERQKFLLTFLYKLIWAWLKKYHSNLSISSLTHRYWLFFSTNILVKNRIFGKEEIYLLDNFLINLSRRKQSIFGDESKIYFWKKDLAPNVLKYYPRKTTNKVLPCLINSVDFQKQWKSKNSISKKKRINGANFQKHTVCFFLEDNMKNSFLYSTNYMPLAFGTFIEKVKLYSLVLPVSNVRINKESKFLLLSAIFSSSLKQICLKNAVISKTYSLSTKNNNNNCPNILKTHIKRDSIALTSKTYTKGLSFFYSLNYFQFLYSSFSPLNLNLKTCFSLDQCLLKYSIDIQTCNIYTFNFTKKEVQIYLSKRLTSLVIFTTKIVVSFRQLNKIPKTSNFRRKTNKLTQFSYVNVALLLPMIKSSLNNLHYTEDKTKNKLFKKNRTSLRIFLQLELRDKVKWKIPVIVNTSLIYLNFSKIECFHRIIKKSKKLKINNIGLWGITNFILTYKKEKYLMKIRKFLFFFNLLSKYYFFELSIQQSSIEKIEREKLQWLKYIHLSKKTKFLEIWTNYDRYSRFTYFLT